MITDPDRFKHNRSPYERPDFKYRCGRGAKWEKPCHAGPNPDGTCGGVFECQPVKNAKGRYECKRPSQAGGPCQQGPAPDGSCSQKHPPCVPELTLRHQRRKLTLFFSLFVFASIAVLLVLSKNSFRFLSPVDPGPLSMSHATFTSEEGCLSCHDVHDTGGAAWVKALFTKNDLSAKCLNCHRFAGPAELAHNQVFPERPALPKTACVMCHQEHQGPNVDFRVISDKQCHACHLQQFKSFTQGHPPFPENFPHETRTSVFFDHASHFGKHFKNPSVQKSAPEDCMACHAVSSTSQRHVKTGGFEQNCASCHQAEILKAELPFFRSPELMTNSLTRKEIHDACGPVLWTFLKSLPSEGEGGFAGRSLEGEDYESISIEEPTLLSGYLLDVEIEDPETYGPPIQQWMLAMAQRSLSSIEEKLQEHHADAEVSKMLLAGLDPALVKLAACTWIANQEYTAPGEQGLGGWYADLLELKYRPMSHADPVVKSWIEFSLKASQEAEGTEHEERTNSVRDLFLSPKQGVGRCLKCHTVNADKMDWTYHQKQDTERFTFFNHGLHLQVLGGGSKACTTCHVTDMKAAYAESFRNEGDDAYVSNFKPIKKESCMQCHGGNIAATEKVRQDCLLCHTYHLNPSLTKSMLGQKDPEKLEALEKIEYDRNLK